MTERLAYTAPTAPARSGRPMAYVVAAHTPVATFTAIPKASALATMTAGWWPPPSHNGTAENAVAPRRNGKKIATAAFRRVSRANCSRIPSIPAVAYARVRCVLIATDKRHQRLGHPAPGGFRVHRHPLPPARSRSLLSASRHEQHDVGGTGNLAMHTKTMISLVRPVRGQPIVIRPSSTKITTRPAKSDHGTHGGAERKAAEGAHDCQRVTPPASWDAPNSAIPMFGGSCRPRPKMPRRESKPPVRT